MRTNHQKVGTDGWGGMYIQHAIKILIENTIFDKQVGVGGKWGEWDSVGLSRCMVRYIGLNGGE